MAQLGWRRQTRNVPACQPPSTAHTAALSRFREQRGFPEQAWSACCMGVVSASSNRYGTGARQDAVDISASGWDDGNQDEPNDFLLAGLACERRAFGPFYAGGRSRRAVLPRNAVRSPT